MLILLSLLLGCPANDGRIPLQYCEDVTLAHVPEPVSTPLTWHQDVAPLLHTHCVSCHTAGGPAPFPLDSYAEVSTRTAAIEDSLLTGRMPPWSAPDCCGKTYRDSRRLPAADVNQLVGWIAQGAPEGDETSPAPIPPLAATGLDRVDATISTGPYEAAGLFGSTDDLRCFVIEIPPSMAGAFVTGMNIRPGNSGIVHHVTVNAVSAWREGPYVRQDNSDDGPGYECRGGQGSLGDRSIGIWVPGQAALDLPDGLGIELPDAGKIIVGMHYDLSASEEDTLDQTEVDFTMESSVDKEVVPISALNPLWVFDGGMKIPGDFAETGYGFAWDPQVLYGIGTDWDLWGAFIHMHEFGTSGSVALVKKRGEQECLLHIPEWDFFWQANYWYDEPTRMNAGDKLYVECNWRNPGEEMAWGDDEEMCGAIVYATKAER